MRQHARVERSLYQKANGYSYDAVKIFMPAGAKKPVYAPYVEHVPPDTTAAIFSAAARAFPPMRDKFLPSASGVERSRRRRGGGMGFGRAFFAFRASGHEFLGELRAAMSMARLCRVLVGVSVALTIQFWPAASSAVIYALMVLVLLLRPRGLLG